MNTALQLPDKVEIGIKRIKLLSFTIQDTKQIVVADRTNINLEPDLKIEPENDLIIFQIKTTLSSLETKEVYATGVVQNIFMVKNVKKLTSPENPSQITIPDGVLYTIVGLSISHTRALMAHALSGTTYEQIYIPIVNPVDVTAQFFKTMQKVELK